MAAFGIGEDAAEEWLAAEDEAENDEAEESKCYIYPANVYPVRVFLGCRIDLAVGMGGAFYTGISSTELLAVCDLLQVPAHEREATLYGVRTMLNYVLPELNRRD